MIDPARLLAAQLDAHHVAGRGLAGGFQDGFQRLHLMGGHEIADEIVEGLAAFGKLRCRRAGRRAAHRARRGRLGHRQTEEARK